MLMIWESLEFEFHIFAWVTHQRVHDAKLLIGISSNSKIWLVFDHCQVWSDWKFPELWHQQEDGTNRWFALECYVLELLGPGLIWPLLLVLYEWIWLPIRIRFVEVQRSWSRTDMTKMRNWSIWKDPKCSFERTE